MQLNNCYYKSLQQFVDYYSSNTARELAKHYHLKTEDFMPAFTLAENYVEKLSRVMHAVDEGVRHTVQVFSASELIENCYKGMRERIVQEIPDIKQLTDDVIHKIQAIEEKMLLGCISRSMEMPICGRQSGNCMQMNEILSHSCSVIMPESEPDTAGNKLFYVALGIGMLAALYFCVRCVKNLFLNQAAEKPADGKSKWQIRPAGTEVRKAKAERREPEERVSKEKTGKSVLSSAETIVEPSFPKVNVESSSAKKKNTEEKPPVNSIENQWVSISRRVQSDIKDRKPWSQTWTQCSRTSN